MGQRRIVRKGSNYIPVPWDKEKARREYLARKRAKEKKHKQRKEEERDLQ